MSLALTAYRVGMGLLEPFAPALLRDRLAKGKEDALRLDERLGRSNLTRPEGRLAWFHAASVGESLSLLPVIEGLLAQRADVSVLVTTGTVTSARLMAERLPPRAIHQFVPVDAPGAVKRFLDRWRPDLAVFVESELWPNLLFGAQARGAKVALVSARLGEDSARGWARAPDAAARLLSVFDLILPQDEATAARLKRLGARDDGRANLKFAGEPLPHDPAALSALQAAAEGRPVVLAASTHPGEDEIVLDAFAGLSGHAARPLLAIAPRHPVRGEAVAALAAGRGFTVRRRAAGESPEGADVYLADTLGEMGTLIRWSRAVFVGGSLDPTIGGHNPLEPARLDRPCASGPFFENWTGVFEALIGAGGVRITPDADALARFFAEAIDARACLCDQAEKARLFAAEQAGAAELVVERLKELLG